MPEDEKLTMLLCDEQERSLPSGIKAIFRPPGELPILPDWAKIRFVNPSLRRKLEKLLESKDARRFFQKLKPFGAVEYSLSALIRPVLAEANRQVLERPEDESLVRAEALQFLWSVHQTLGSESRFPADVTVKLPNQIGHWADPKILYMGEGYGQEGNVTQDLYANWAKEKLIATPSILGLSPASWAADLESFLSWLGVVRWPRESVAQSEDKTFLEELKSSFRYPVKFQDYEFDSPNQLSRARIEGLKTLDGLHEILGSAPTESVLAWLALDPHAVTWTSPNREHFKLMIQPRHAQYARRCNEPVPSYIHWQISTFPWLPSSDGTKQPPRSCHIGERQLDALFPSPLNPDLELLEHYGIKTRVSVAFRLAGVRPGLAHLDREELYKLLLEAPERSPDGKAGRALCRWIVNNEKTIFGSAGPFQERFLREGRVWGVKEGVSISFTGFTNLRMTHSRFQFFRIRWHRKKRGKP